MPDKAVGALGKAVVMVEDRDFDDDGAALRFAFASFGVAVLIVRFGPGLGRRLLRLWRRHLYRL